MNLPPYTETELRLLELFSRLRPAISDYEQATGDFLDVFVSVGGDEKKSYAWNGEEMLETESQEVPAWRPFIASEPLPTSDSLLLVTNNLAARTPPPSSTMSHIWLVRGVFRVPSGEVQAVAEGIRLKKLTHYRKVVV